MSESPPRADAGGFCKGPLTRKNGGHRHDMICVDGVPHSEKEAEEERGQLEGRGEGGGQGVGRRAQGAGRRAQGAERRAPGARRRARRATKDIDRSATRPSVPSAIPSAVLW